MPDRTCIIEGCFKPVRVKSRGWCSMHYQRWAKHGDPTQSAVIRGDHVKRFWASVDKRGPDECWPWIGDTNDGYGKFYLNGTTAQAHRFGYEITIGPIPEGLELDHVKARGCTRRDCVNPAHLEPVTSLVNTRRSRIYGGDDAFPCGHPRTEKNTIVGVMLPGRTVSHTSCARCHYEALRTIQRRKRRAQGRPARAVHMCEFCTQNISVRTNGRVYRHRASHDARLWCEGSDTFPTFLEAL